MLAAFVTGFETAARIGDGLGEPVSARGWHGTGVFGRLGAELPLGRPGNHFPDCLLSRGIGLCVAPLEQEEHGGVALLQQSADLGT